MTNTLKKCFLIYCLAQYPTNHYKHKEKKGRKYCAQETKLDVVVSIKNLRLNLNVCTKGKTNGLALASLTERPYMVLICLVSSFTWTGTS